MGSKLQAVTGKPMNLPLIWLVNISNVAAYVCASCWMHPSSHFQHHHWHVNLCNINPRQIASTLFYVWQSLLSLLMHILSYDHTTRLVLKVRQLYMNAKLHSFYTSSLVKIVRLPHFSFDNFGFYSSLQAGKFKAQTPIPTFQHWSLYSKS